MKNYLIIGIRYGVYISMMINTTQEFAIIRAKQRGFTEIYRVEEA